MSPSSAPKWVGMRATRHRPTPLLDEYAEIEYAALPVNYAVFIRMNHDHLRLPRLSPTHVKQVERFIERFNEFPWGWTVAIPCESNLAVPCRDGAASKRQVIVAQCIWLHTVSGLNTVGTYRTQSHTRRISELVSCRHSGTLGEAEEIEGQYGNHSAPFLEAAGRVRLGPPD
jgi:hypothetical protein